MNTKQELTVNELNDPKLCISLDNFFKKEIDKKEFAKQLRLLQYIATNLFLHNTEDLHKHHLMNTTFWINHFAETLDPYFDKE
jgi:hypothetical protein